MQNYSDLVNSIKNWSGRSDLDAVIPDFIQMAEARMNTDLELKELETSAALTLVSGLAALPADFNGVLSVIYNDTPLKYATPEYSSEMYGAEAGTPAVYTISGLNLIVSPRMDGDITLHYRKTISGLTALNPVNDIFTSYPDLYLHACLMYAAEFAHDADKILFYSQAYAQDIQRINAAGWAVNGPMEIRLS